jgi:hypothetical protein
MLRKEDNSAVRLITEYGRVVRLHNLEIRERPAGLPMYEPHVLQMNSSRRTEVGISMGWPVVLESDFLHRWSL